MFPDDSSSSWSDEEPQMSTREEMFRPSNRALFSIDRNDLRQANPDDVCPIVVTPEPDYDDLAKYLLDLYVDAHPPSFEKTKTLRMPEITAPPLHSDVPVDWTCFFPNSDVSSSEDTFARTSSYAPDIEFEVQPSEEAIIDKNNKRSEEENDSEVKEEENKPQFREYVLFPTPSSLWLKQRLLRTLPGTLEPSPLPSLNDSALVDDIFRALNIVSKRKGDEVNTSTPLKKAKIGLELETDRCVPLHSEVLENLREEIRKKFNKFPAFPVNNDDTMKPKKGSTQSDRRTSSDALRDLTNQQQANLFHEHLAPLRMKPCRPTLHNPSGASRRTHYRLLQ